VVVDTTLVKVSLMTSVVWVKVMLDVDITLVQVRLMTGDTLVVVSVWVMFWVLVAVVVCWVVWVVVVVCIGCVVYRVRYPMLKTARKATINAATVMGLRSADRLRNGAVMRLIDTPRNAPLTVGSLAST